jgi:nucleotidyltransferase substrate binding protein (TIGR01987 family)
VDDVRWMQRLANYRRAVANLEAALRQDSYNDLELQGLIKGFELCYELAWKTLQDFLRQRGYADIAGPKPAIRQAFKDGLIDHGDVWQAIHEARNLAAHTYDLDQARRLASEIRGSYAPAFRMLEDRLRREAAT